MSSEHEDSARTGLLFAFVAYFSWGLFPLYWRFLDHIPALEILAHRMVWSLALMVLILGGLKRWAWLHTVTLRSIIIYLVAAVMLAINWGVYIWAVNAGFVVETSLGYFMNPMFNVLFGAVFLGERMRPVQWVAISLAAIGVLYLTVVYGQVPYIALTLACSFATYGLIKKKYAKQGPMEGVTLEAGLLFLPALVFLIYSETQHGNFLGGDIQTIALLIGAGGATMLPLLCFAAAVPRLSFTVLGIMQYIAPTLQFLIGVMVFHEPMSMARLGGFVFIWLGLLLFTTESILRQRAIRRKLASSTCETPGS